MKKLIDMIVSLFNDDVDKDMMRLARYEYKKDQEYAYHMLIQGKLPEIGNVKWKTFLKNFING